LWQTPEELVEPILAEERFTIELHRGYTTLSGVLVIHLVLRPDVVGLLRVRLDAPRWRTPSMDTRELARRADAPMIL
jgi:hypothetical protein